MDTWATSSMSPQIVGHWLDDRYIYGKVFPFTLRPQAHEIIRTWTFYTLVKSFFHFGSLPWKEIAISGWAIAPQGMYKISKSRGGGPASPDAMIEHYSADAVRYWAACTGFGIDAVISEEKIQAGARLVTKLWNVARFSERFIIGYRLPEEMPAFSPADRWILASLQGLIQRASDQMKDYDYAAARSEMESFFWRNLADNYLEMAKQRLYSNADVEEGPDREGARFCLYTVTLAIIKLLAPFLPFVTEEIYQGLFANQESGGSLHLSRWPQVDPLLSDSRAAERGELLVMIATAARRYKSERNISLAGGLDRLQLACSQEDLIDWLDASRSDLASVTRAATIEIKAKLDLGLEVILADGPIQVAVAQS
jgi:valyl-tRNA synthetase